MNVFMVNRFEPEPLRNPKQTFLLQYTEKKHFQRLVLRYNFKIKVVSIEK